MRSIEVLQLRALKLYPEGPAFVQRPPASSTARHCAGTPGIDAGPTARRRRAVRSPGLGACRPGQRQPGPAPAARLVREPMREVRVVGGDAQNSHCILCGRVKLGDAAATA